MIRINVDGVQVMASPAIAAETLLAMANNLRTRAIESAKKSLHRASPGVTARKDENS